MHGPRSFLKIPDRLICKRRIIEGENRFLVLLNFVGRGDIPQGRIDRVEVESAFGAAGNGASIRASDYGRSIFIDRFTPAFRQEHLETAGVRLTKPFFRFKGQIGRINRKPGFEILTRLLMAETFDTG